jgi:hypothetical protein
MEWVSFLSFAGPNRNPIGAFPFGFPLDDSRRPDQSVAPLNRNRTRLSKELPLFHKTLTKGASIEFSRRWFLLAGRWFSMAPHSLERKKGENFSRKRTRPGALVEPHMPANVSEERE